MKLRFLLMTMTVLGLAAQFASETAYAQTRIGEAALIKNEVVQLPASRPINVGDAIVRDEVVRTGKDSAARLVMADNTNLSMGAGSTIKLDRAVYNDDHSYRDIAIRLTSGAFRFVTGDSEKAAYKISTPLATIGVRGTTLDILSVRGQTVVVLQHGAASVCIAAGQCIDLLQPGDTAVITSVGGKVTLTKTNTPPWTFAAACASAAGLCTTTQYADASTVTPPVEDDPTGMLCGR